MVNEIALVLLYGLFGWEVAALYLVTGLAHRHRRRLGDRTPAHGALRRGLGARDPHGRRRGRRRSSTGPAASPTPGRRSRTSSARCGSTCSPASPSAPSSTATCRRTSWRRIMGADAWWSVPLAVLLGIPMYSNAAGIIPIVEALLEKGAALGTVLAFMMAVIALSLPETIILKKVLKWPLISRLPRRGRRRHHVRRLPVQRGPLTGVDALTTFTDRREVDACPAAARPSRDRARDRLSGSRLRACRLPRPGADP